MSREVVGTLAVAGTLSNLSCGRVVARTLTSAFADVYRDFADRIALVGDSGERLTYGELGSRARRLAGGLASLGLSPGDRVIVFTKNRPECVVIDHGLAAGGFVRVPLSYRLHAREVADIARDCAAEAVLVDRERERDIAANLAAGGLGTSVVALDEPTGVVAARYADLLESPESAPPHVTAEQLAWLPYTSGTTGEPKGVMLSHRSLLACARNQMVELDRVETDDVLLHVAPFSHLSGFVALPYTLRGARHVCLSKFEPDRTLQAIAEHGVTVVAMVPTMLNLMLPILEAAKQSGALRVDSLHTVVYGGSAVAPERLARLVACLGDVFLQAYGLTEIPFPLAALSKADHRVDPAGSVPSRLASAGRVNPFVELRVRRPDGKEAIEGEEGEIQARGDTTMLGYWNRPEATAEVLLDDGWVATGDIGRIRDGYLYIVDRKKEMIVSGGFNIFPAEVEHAIAVLDAVDEVAVVGVPDTRWGEAVKAVVVVRDGYHVTKDDIDTICRERIASFKRPRSVDFVPVLPKTGSGKIQRQVIRERYRIDHKRHVGE